jgi:hypothetical protein
MPNQAATGLERITFVLVSQEGVQIPTNLTETAENTPDNRVS